MDAAVQWSADCLVGGAVLLGVAIVVIARRPVFNRPIAVNRDGRGAGRPA